jgi:mRNA interferase YafQ
LAKRQHKDLAELKTVINMLLNDEKLPRKYKDHKLTGDLKSYRELHLNPDWLLMYRIDEKTNELRLADLGSHAELYE